MDVYARGQVGADRGQKARDGVELSGLLAETAARNAAQEADGVRVTRVVEDFLGRSLLDELACVEHADAFAHLPDDA